MRSDNREFICDIRVLRSAFQSLILSSAFCHALVSRPTSIACEQHLTCVGTGAANLRVSSRLACERASDARDQRVVSKVAGKCQIPQRPFEAWPCLTAQAFLLVLYPALISTCSQVIHNPTEAHTRKKNHSHSMGKKEEIKTYKQNTEKSNTRRQ